MSSPLTNPSRQESQGADWSRLIPGDMLGTGTGRRKPPRPVRESGLPAVMQMSADTVAAPFENSLAFLLPRPLKGHSAWKWLRSVGADFALVGLNWLLVGAVMVTLHALFPRIWSFGYAAGSPLSLLGVGLLNASLITLISYAEGLYAEGNGRRRQARILANAILWSTAILGFGYGLQGAPWTRSALFAVAGLLHLAALLAWRWQTGLQTKSAGRSKDSRNVLIVGAGGIGRRLASHIEEAADRRRVCGFLDNETPLGDGILGRVSDLPRLARTGFVDEVILAAPQDRTLALHVLREARRLRLDVEIAPDLFGCSPAESEVETVGGLPLICLRSERTPTAGLVLKRLADLTGAGFALIAASPVLLAIAAFVKLDSRGPVIYSAYRVGRKGRRFRCYKFRTMVENADELKDGLRANNQRSGPFFKIADDPRVTRLGRFLRRYSLDELPQLFNVLKGDMSLVGPRPHPVDDFAVYETEHLGRLDVTPGMTGLWQVEARRDPSFQRGMELDREYIRTWSLSLDLRILLRTVRAVVRGGGE